MLFDTSFFLQEWNDSLSPLTQNMKIKILSLLILSSLFSGLTSQVAWSNPQLPDARDRVLSQIIQGDTRTIEYQWPSTGNTGLTSFEIPSDYRAVTYNAGSRSVEGIRYDDIQVLILSPEEYQLWQNNPSQSRSLGVRVDAVFDQELMWTMDSPPDMSRINQNGHQTTIYRVGGVNEYIGVISHSDGIRNSVQVVVANERHHEVAEMIMNSFEYL
jgi:hypothetical protein